MGFFGKKKGISKIGKFEFLKVFLPPPIVEFFFCSQFKILIFKKFLEIFILIFFLKKPQFFCFFLFFFQEKNHQKINQKNPKITKKNFPKTAGKRGKRKAENSRNSPSVFHLKVFAGRENSNF